MRIKKVLISIISLIISLAVLGVFFNFIFLPIANWYYQHYLLGVDFFLTGTIVSFLKNNFSLPFNGYFDFWWSGMPLTAVLNPLHYYLILPFVYYFNVIDGIKIYILTSIFLSGVFTYIVCLKLSKNHFVAIVLASLVLYSEGFYGALTWGGSLPYFATQMFLPAVVIFLLIHLERRDKKYLIVSASILGLSFLAHPLGMIAFTVPLTVLILLFGLRMHPVSIKAKVKDLLIIGIISFLVGLPLTINFLTGLLGVLGTGGANLAAYSGGSSVNIDKTVETYIQSRFPYLFTQVNNLFYTLLVFAIIIYPVAFIFGKKRKEGLMAILPLLLFTLYVIGQVAVNAFGHPIFSQAWYRAYWPFAFALAFLIASLIGATYKLLIARLKALSVFHYLLFSLVFTGVFTASYFNHLPAKLLEQIEAKSSTSSAYPEAINIAKTEEQRNELKKKMLPSFINSNEKNYRLYESDAQTNIWWGYAYKIPLVRGYIDQPLATLRIGNIFTLDQAIGNEGLVNNFKYDPGIAKNIALYYLDWYAIKYFEGGHASISPNTRPSSYLKEAIEKTEETKVSGLVRLYQTKSGKAEIQDIEQSLYFYKFKDELISPILSAVNTPLVLVITDDQSYDNVTRILSYENINSQKVIPIWKSEYLDNFSKEELSQFAAVFAYNYKYQNKDKAYRILTEYVNEGGKLFIDTGFDFPDSTSSNLPQLFPFRTSERNTLDETWDLEFAKDKITEGLTQEDFGPPIYDKLPWKFTYPTEKSIEGAKIILTNHQKPILISYGLGSGKVFWSGMNLPYHIVSSEGKDERKIFTAILADLVPLQISKPIMGEANFLNPREIIFKTQEGRGVLLRQQKYNYWEVKVNGHKKTAYAAGPAYPGFIYVPLQGEKSPYQVTFKFLGDGQYFRMWLVVFITLFGVLDYVFLKSILFGGLIMFIKKGVGKKISKWWEREEED